MERKYLEGYLVWPVGYGIVADSKVQQRACGFELWARLPLVNITTHD
jgi:hypothetical protein